MGGSNTKSPRPRSGHKTFHESLSILRSTPTLYMRQDLPHDLRLCCSGDTFRLQDYEEALTLDAAEEPLCNVCCGRWCCGPARGFTMRVRESEPEKHGNRHQRARKQPVLMTAERAACRFDWGCCCLDCCCCAHRVIVRDAYGDLLGRAVQRFSCCHPRLAVEDEEGELVAEVRGPCCPCRCCCDQTFSVFVPEPDEDQDQDSENEPRMRQDGFFLKRWEADDGVVEEQPKRGSGGYAAEDDEEEDGKEKKKRKYNMDHEHTQVIFPEGAEDNEKALLLGAFFLVNYMFFDMS